MSGQPRKRPTRAHQKRIEFERLHAAWTENIFRACRRILADDADALDAAQDVYVLLWRKYKVGTLKDTSAAYIVTIATRVAVEKARQRRKRNQRCVSNFDTAEVDFIAEHPSRELAPLPAAELVEFRTFVEEAIAKLPEAQREAIRLVMQDGSGGVACIAKSLGIGSQTYRARIFRGREKLREALERHGYKLGFPTKMAHTTRPHDNSDIYVIDVNDDWALSSASIVVHDSGTGRRVSVSFSDLETALRKVHRHIFG